MKKVIFLIFLILVSANIKKNYKAVVAVEVKEDIILDGILNEKVYESISVNEFTQRDPNEGEPATEKTKVWIFYDQTYLYVSAMCFDSQPESIDKSLLRRDNYQATDWFNVFIDSFKDNRNGYFFGVNPAGSKNDGTMFNDGWDDDSWDGIWDVFTNVSENGWSLEMRIPFSQLRFNKADELIWGINFKRSIKRNNETSYYVMVPKKESGFISHFAELHGLKGIEPKQRFEIMPYIVQKAQYLVHDNNDPFYKGNQYKTNLGGDVKIGLGSNLNLDLTINPDFGQVEVDPASVNLSAFETYYNEKRPFFIEGSNTFSFGYGGANNNWGFNFGVPELFYSRRIGRSPQGWAQHEGFTNQPSDSRILGAAKVTGKIGNNFNLGVLSAITERMYAVTDSNNIRFSDEVEPFTHYGVVRAQQQFNDGKQSLGFIFTSVNRDLKNNYLKNYLSSEAYTFGFDGWTFLDSEQEYVITASAVGSYTTGSKEYMQRLQKRPYRYFQNPNSASDYSFDSSMTSMAGWFTRIMLNKQKGNFYINAAIGASSPTFEYNDFGSQWFANRINSHLVLGYRWFEPDGVFRRKFINIAYNRNQEFDGYLLRNGIFITSNVQFMNYYGLGFNLSYNFESTSRTLTRGGPIVLLPKNVFGGLNFNTDYRNDFVYSANVNFGGSKKTGYNYSIGANIEWKPSTQLSLNLGPEFSFSNNKQQWIGAYSDNTAELTYGNRYIFGEIKQTTISANLRINYTFNPELSLQLYLQPLFAIGDYDNFSELTKAKTGDFNYFDKNTNSSVYFDKDKNSYVIKPDISNNSKEIKFNNPDFNFKSLRANLVLRWEVKAGSVLYLVWTHDKTDYRNPGEFSFGRDFRDLMSQESNNIFMAKFSYWFNL